MSSLARLLNTFPVPLFGSVRTAAAFTLPKAKTLPRFAGWLGPGAVGALWFVWPAVDDGWKIEMGLKADPEAAKKAADAAPADAPKKVELSVEALAKVEDAYKAEEVNTEDDEPLAKAVATGDFSYFEEKWEAFSEKSGRPGEDDDDDDEDDDDDDEDDDEDDDDDE
mmetsp:Transcript_39823/g.83720  ORF Transcript_39823/g.83720 Transcript_39823/m.83720 type:complete len:167 (-) Transcript_39823:297-797(-)